MRIACFQGPEVAGTPAGNLARLERLAAEAAGRGAALLVCPELWLTGYALDGDSSCRSCRHLHAVASLVPGLTPERAQAELRA